LGSSRFLCRIGVKFKCAVRVQPLACDRTHGQQFEARFLLPTHITGDVIGASTIEIPAPARGFAVLGKKFPARSK
jgi:hypothetical protein